MNLRDLAAALGAELTGSSGEEEVLGITGLGNAAAGHVAYVEGEARLGQAEAGPALALIAPLALRESAKPLLRVRNARLAYARALSLLGPAGGRLPPGVHPTAQVGADVVSENGAAVGAYAVIGDGARIGRGAQIHPLVAVGRGVVVGEESVIYPNVTLYDGVQLGARVIVHSGSVIGSDGFGYAQDGERHVKIPHVGTVIIEDDVEIGANVSIDRGTTGATVIGQGTKIDNLVQVAHNVKVGRNCILAGQVGISGSVTLGDGVMLAGQAGIADHTNVGEGARGAARAGIMSDVPAGTVVMGMPARPRGEQLRIDAAARGLPDLVRQVRELTRRVAELEKRLSDSSD
ncbi:MAG: UDP-3-O-(3-hydroxymyristoyl)glucosamine N-acyltransferase [Armatimonadota bacterium]|nr:MAG: UDP-3-O-(3-hydroxymyristoyl)glucosamine N-acyltransferase [Armatimonadota bacterium]